MIDDEELWSRYFAAAITLGSSFQEDIKLADAALEYHRQRWPKEKLCPEP